MTLSIEAVLQALRPIKDPDLGKSIVDLDFIKNVQVNDGGEISLELVLTTPACPVRDQLRAACETAVQALAGVSKVTIELKADTRGAAAGGRQVLPDVKNIVAIASGKGGVAKSTTAVNIAVALQQTGAKVGILDADIYGPSVPTMMEVEDEPSLGDGNVINPAFGLGIKVVSIGFFLPAGRAAVLRGPMVSGYISQFLGSVNWGALDYLIVDYPPGTGDIQLTLSQQAAITAAVVCTTPQDISLIDVEKAMSMFEITKIPILGVIETMSYFVCDNCGTRHHLFGHGGGERLAKTANVPLLAQIPIDPRVVEGGDVGRPIMLEHPDSPVAKAYSEAAGAIAARLSKLHLGTDGALESFSLSWDA